MNKKTYQSFQNELEKQANIYDWIGKAVANTTQFAWRHPKTTLGAVLGGLALPHLFNVIFPAAVVGSQHAQMGIMDNQSEIMNNILKEERLRNFKPVIKTQKPIERPLV
jgi:hypothetical protein